MKDIYLVSTVRVVVPDTKDETAEEILAYLAANCDTATLTGTAERFSFHPNTVSSLIKRATGKTFSQVLREMRMQRACELLGRPDVPIAQVARLCGYENPSNFYRVFREEFGVTPRAWAEKAGRGKKAADDGAAGEPEK